MEEIHECIFLCQKQTRTCDVIGNLSKHETQPHISRAFDILWTGHISANA